jgi:hypothetical protein
LVARPEASAIASLDWLAVTAFSMRMRANEPGNRRVRIVAVKVRPSVQCTSFPAESIPHVDRIVDRVVHSGGNLVVAQKVDVGSSSRSCPHALHHGSANGDVREGHVEAGHRRVSRKSISLRAMLCIALSAFVADASAIGLGAASLTSGLGEPLRLSFAVTLAADEDVGCIQVRPRGDDLPSAINVRSSVVRSGSQTRIEIRSLEPVNEPAIGLIVSVGCASPVARDYILFLDPPIIAATAPDVADAAQTPRSVVEPRVPRRLAVQPMTRRPPSTARRSVDASGPTTDATAPTPAKPPRSNRRRSSPATAPAVSATLVPQAAPAPDVAPASAPTSRAGDRLSVVPTEPPPTGAAPKTSSSPGAVSSAPSTATSSASSTTSSASIPAAVVPAPDAPASDADAVAAREQALKQQQTDLQVQLKALSDQIAALRVQTATLAARNQALEESAYSPTLIWLLIALAVIAIIVAGWMAWRYTQLRRSLEGSAWWTNNTLQAPSTGMTVAPVETQDDLADLDAGTRMAPRPATQTDVRSNVAAPSQVSTTSNLERSRPMSRGANYPPAIDTDFTVSDIEAAMATVRTVSPPRPAARKPDLDDSDFAALGGPTIPSPFSDPPPAVARSAKPAPADDLGKFVDLDISPTTAPLTSRAPTTSESLRMSMGLSRNPSPPPVEVPAEEAAPIDFKLDITNPFDPLSTDSHKTTIVDRAEPVQAVDFELPSAPSPLDFELPSATQIMTIHGHSMEPTEVIQPRHGATALDDLFASNAGLGPDTILDLDERHGSPLSTTEVDRLTSTEVNGADPVAQSSTRARMARFADLMNQVDEGATTDPLRAIALLRQYVLRDERIPTLLWLRLFDLYKAVDKRPVYEALAEHFNRRYHRPMVSWSQTLADRVPQTPLSAFHELDREIEASWGTEQGLDRLQTLLCDRSQDDSIVFNAVLQHDLLDAAKIYPISEDTKDGPAPSSG